MMEAGKEKKKMSTPLKVLLFIIGGIFILAAAFVIYIAVMLTDNPLSTVKKTFDKPSDYYEVFVDNYSENTKEYQMTHDAPFDMIPAEPAGEITEFSYTYYNSWDAERLLAMTVRYDSAGYEEEMERLEKFGIGDFTGIYSVTGEAPSGYKIIAMIPDTYSGFSYALVPEQEDRTITYVVIDFCNYFLDIDIHKYFPEKFLLPGFDAAEDNPYRQKMLPQ